MKLDRPRMRLSSSPRGALSQLDGWCNPRQDNRSLRSNFMANNARDIYITQLLIILHSLSIEYLFKRRIMSLTLTNTDAFVEPHVLCDYCRATCNSSSIIQTYTKHGNDETYVALRQRCLSTTRKEKFAYCSVNDFQASYQSGCHLCTLLWHYSMGNEDTVSRRIREANEYEEKNSISQLVLIIECSGIDNNVEIVLCTRMKDSHLSRGFALEGYLIRDFEGNSQCPF